MEGVSVPPDLREEQNALRSVGVPWNFQQQQQQELSIMNFDFLKVGPILAATLLYLRGLEPGARAASYGTRSHSYSGGAEIQ